MRFKHFMEAGHFRVTSGGELPVLYKGRTITLDDIVSIDPRFEAQDIPPQNPRLKKFLGETDFSLPLSDGRWIVSNRFSMMSGEGHVGNQPEGFRVPSNWAEYADFMDSKGARVDPGEVIAV